MKRLSKFIILLMALQTSLVAATPGDPKEEVLGSVRIGTLYWMSVNLDVDTFRNGDPIPEARTAEEWQRAGMSGAPAFCYYQNDPANGKRYGKLYNWYAVTDPRGLAPEGWHVASDQEWRQCTTYLGGEDAAGTKMKSQTGWLEDGNGTNSSGFSGLPAGCRDLNGTFANLGTMAFWWTSTPWNSDLAWYRCIDQSPWYVYRTNYYKANGYSVRCVQDPVP